MLKKTSHVLLTAVFTAFAGTPGFAADHREAPAIQEDPTADIADIYAFRNPSDASSLVLVMTVNPFSIPRQASSYNFSPNVRYRFFIDNNADALPDHSVDFTFSGRIAPGQQGFQPQTFQAAFPGGVIVTGQATSPTVLNPQPADPIIVDGPSGIRIFAGPREDPFFFDSVGFSRFVNGVGGFSGADTFDGFNVSAIVAELPLSMVTGDSNLIEIWGVTERREVTIRRIPENTTSTDFGEFRQVERMGNPAIDTALIPPPLKDAFNIGEPKDDIANFALVGLQTLQTLGTSGENIQILASVAAPDTLKLDLTNPDGYPNGRRLQDDVIDTLLFFILNQPADFPGDLADGEGKIARFSDEFPFLAPPLQAP